MCVPFSYLHFIRERMGWKEIPVVKIEDLLSLCVCIVYIGPWPCVIQIMSIHKYYSNWSMILLFVSLGCESGWFWCSSVPGSRRYHDSWNWNIQMDGTWGTVLYLLEHCDCILKPSWYRNSDLMNVGSFRSKLLIEVFFISEWLYIKTILL